MFTLGLLWLWYGGEFDEGFRLRYTFVSFCLFRKYQFCGVEVFGEVIVDRVYQDGSFTSYFFTFVFPKLAIVSYTIITCVCLFTFRISQGDSLIRWPCFMGDEYPLNSIKSGTCQTTAYAWFSKRRVKRDSGAIFIYFTSDEVGYRLLVVRWGNGFIAVIFPCYGRRTTNFFLCFRVVTRPAFNATRVAIIVDSNFYLLVLSTVVKLQLLFSQRGRIGHLVDRFNNFLFDRYRFFLGDFRLFFTYLTRMCDVANVIWARR